tara:strand:- start:125 stop:499 length:375 start_codon:yes stop_codon:yes gene_type:complete
MEEPILETKPFGFLPRNPIKYFKLTLWVLLHWLVVLGNFSAFFILIYNGLHPDQTIPWYVAVPLCTFIGVITFSRVLDCPLTGYENKLRQRVGLPPIKAFIKHYFIRPYVKRRYNKKKKRKEKK